MTKARDLANIISGGFTEADIPNLPASKITSGTFADARLSQSSVQQYASTFDDNKLVNDISTLALRQASNENKSAYNTNSMYVDVFQDSTGIGSTSNTNRHSDEYVSAASESADSATTFSYTGSDQTYTPSGKSKMDVYMWGAAGGAGYNYSSGGGGGRVTHTTAGAGGYTSGTITISGSPTFKIVVGQGGSATDVATNYTNVAYGGGGRGNVQGHYGVGGGGGGYSGIFLTSVAHSNSILIAGGGSGSPSASDGGNHYSGNGGGTTGQDGGKNNSSGHLADGNGKGGTQSAGGAAGATNYTGNISTAGSALQGGDGDHMCGGGGGGYYGGGGGGHTGNYGSSGSGGGSGYIGGHASAVVSNGVTEGSTETAEGGTATPPQTSSSYYSSGIGQGNNGANGGNGKIVIVPYTITTNATGNFISNAITASSSTNKMGAIITYEDNQGTNALNTDIIIQLSADNGSNFTTATLVAMPDFATGIKMCKVNDLSVTAGTQLKYKILFANQSGSKIARIRGVSLQY